MAVLFDTTVPVLLIRSRRRRSAAGDSSELIAAAQSEIEAGSAVLPSVAVSELLVGETSAEGSGALASTLVGLPTVVLPVEAARDAGVMGSFLRTSGGPVPLPDLLIAATALWLEIPLLTWDADFARSRAIAEGSASEHEGAALWRALRLHPASRGT